MNKDELNFVLEIEDQIKDEREYSQKEKFSFSLLQNSELAITYEQKANKKFTPAVADKILSNILSLYEKDNVIYPNELYATTTVKGQITKEPKSKLRIYLEKEFTSFFSKTVNFLGQVKFAYWDLQVFYKHSSLFAFCWAVLYTEGETYIFTQEYEDDHLYLNHIFEKLDTITKTQITTFHKDKSFSRDFDINLSDAEILFILNKFF